MKSKFKLFYVLSLGVLTLSKNAYAGCTLYEYSNSEHQTMLDRNRDYLKRIGGTFDRIHFQMSGGSSVSNFGDRNINRSGFNRDVASFRGQNDSFNDIFRLAVVDQSCSLEVFTDPNFSGSHKKFYAPAQNQFYVELANYGFEEKISSATCECGDVITTSQYGRVE